MAVCLYKHWNRILCDYIWNLQWFFITRLNFTWYLFSSCILMQASKCETPSTASQLRKKLLSIIKYLMHECFMLYPSEYLDPNTSFCNTVHKETSFKIAMIMLHSLQASLIHSKSCICYSFLFLHLGLFIRWQLILQGQPSRKTIT